MICTYLELSTAHLTQETLRELDGESDTPAWMKPDGWPAMTVANYAYGVFVTVPDLSIEDIRAQANNLPDELAACMVYAHKMGIHMLRFDGDGDEIESLLTFEEELPTVMYG